MTIYVYLYGYFECSLSLSKKMNFISPFNICISIYVSCHATQNNSGIYVCIRGVLIVGKWVKIYDIHTLQQWKDEL